MADYYQILGVERDATAAEIKRAYRKKSRQLHPDLNPGEDTSEQFKEVTRAYEVLSNEEKRRNYDATGNENGAPGGFGGGGFGGFSDIFETFFGSGGSRGPASRTQRGQDALISVTLDLHDAVFGAEKTIEVQSAVTCEHCHGDCAEPGTSKKSCTTCQGQGRVTRPVQSILGTVMSTETCPTCQGFGDIIETPCNECGGQGRVRQRRPLTIKIPAGVDTGSRIQISGAGEAGPGGGPNGDLYIEVTVADDDVFRRRGNDLLATIKLPMTAAALGTKVTLDTLDGEREVDVPAGTQSGDVTTLKGLGVGKLRGNSRGDIKITFEVETPTKLDKRQKELLKELAELRNEDVAVGEVQTRGLFSRIKDNWRNRD